MRSPSVSLVAFHIFMIAALVLVADRLSHAEDSRIVLGWSWTDVELRETACGEVEIRIAEATLGLGQPDEPDLPALLVRVRAPEQARPSSYGIAGARTSLKWVEESIRSIPSWTRDGVELSGDDGRVAGTVPFPAERVRYLGLRFQRGEVYAAFAVYPIVVEDDGLSLLEGGVLEVSWESDPDLPIPLKSLRETPVATAAKLHASVLGRAYQGRISDIPSLESDPVDYLILTTEEFQAAVQPLVEWKNLSGTPATVRTVEWLYENYPDGVDKQDRIRRFVTEAYIYWGTEWLLIVGGPEAVPTRTVRSRVYTIRDADGIDIITDLYYVCLDGNWNADGDGLFGEAVRVIPPVNIDDRVDFDAELCVGRVPATTVEEVSTWLQKQLQYVQDPVTDGYLDRMLLLGEILEDVEWKRELWPPCGTYPSDCPDGQCDFCVEYDGARHCVSVIEIVDAAPDIDMDYVELYEFVEYWQVFGDRPNAELEIEYEVLNQLNNGSGFVLHTGHGDHDRWSVGTQDGQDGMGRVTRSDVLALGNGDKVGVGYTCTCNSAAFDGECIGEAFLFAPAGGLITFVGSTSLDFPPASLGFQDRFLRKLFFDELSTGESLVETISERAVGVPQTENFHRFLAYSMALLGDPQLKPWLETPVPLAVQAAESFLLGDSVLAVEVARLGQPAEGATVCVSKLDDQETLYAVAQTGVDGVAMVPFRPTWTGNFAIAVTHSRSIPHREAPVRVVTASPGEGDLSVVGLQVLDLESGAPGYGDGRFEQGETVLLDVIVRNGGTVPAAGTVMLHVGPDELQTYVEVLDGEEVVPPIDPEEEIRLVGAFRVRAVPPIPDEVHENRDRVPFAAVVRVESGRHVESFELPMPCYRPVLEIDVGRLKELSGEGNDGIPDVGESLAWQPTLRNVGTGSTAHLIGHLEAIAGMTVLVGHSLFDAGERSENISSRRCFQFEVTHWLPRARLVIRSTRDPGFVFFNREIDFHRPNYPIWEVAQQSPGVNTIRLVWVRPVSDDVEGYVIERSRDGEPPFQRINDALVCGMQTFEDEGLEPLTRYYYRVTAVDASGNASPPSDIIDVTTVPGHLPGWPALLQDNIEWGCPTIADLDNAGEYEVFGTADQVYAFRADGSEVIDGDGIASSAGIWSSLGSHFWSRSAIGDLDGDGESEVVASSRFFSDFGGTSYTYVWDAEGELLWSRPLFASSWPPSSPVIADIDADEENEVIAHHRGRIYARNHDGTPVLPENADGLLRFVGGDPFESAPYTLGTPAAVDLDGDEKEELVLGLVTNLPTRPIRLVVVDGDGTLLAEADLGHAPDHLMMASSSPSIADVDDDGFYEIFLSTRTDLWALRYVHEPIPNLEQVWRETLPEEQPENRLEPTPALGDVDGDGELDVVLGDSEWLVAVDAATGTDLPGFPVHLVGSDRLGSAILVELLPGPGAEVIIGDIEGWVHAYDGNGKVVPGFPFHHPGRIVHGLTLWDVDRSGRPDLVVQGDKAPRISIFEIPNVEFPASEEEAWARNPWPAFRRDTHNTGSIPIESRSRGLPMDGPTEPLRLCLHQPAPHPAGANAQLRFASPGGALRLEVYDAAGRRLRTLEQGFVPPGTHTRIWDGHDKNGRMVGSGIYWIRLTAEGETAIQKLVLLR